MTDKQKYLIAVTAITLVLGGVWYYAGKGEPESKGSPSVSSDSNASSPASDASPQEKPQSVTEQDMEASRKVAEAFLQAYLHFRGSDPTRHIEEAKPYMTEELYDRLVQNPPRPTAEIQNQKFVEFTGANGMKSDIEGLREVEWAIQAVIEVENAKGKKRKEEWTYLVRLTDDKGWKVMEVMQRGILD